MNQYWQCGPQGEGGAFLSVWLQGCCHTYLKAFNSCFLKVKSNFLAGNMFMRLPLPTASLPLHVTSEHRSPACITALFLVWRRCRPLSSLLVGSSRSQHYTLSPPLHYLSPIFPARIRPSTTHMSSAKWNRIRGKKQLWSYYKRKDFGLYMLLVSALKYPQMTILRNKTYKFIFPKF